MKSRAHFESNTCFLWQLWGIDSHGMSHYRLLLLGITWSPIERLEKMADFFLSLLRTTFSVNKLQSRTLQRVVGDDWGKSIEPTDWGESSIGSYAIKKSSLIPCSSRRKRCPDVSYERFWGPIGGWLEGLRRRRGRYGTAKGQRGVKSASARAVGQARK